MVPESDGRIDDAALHFLLQQSLLARAKEEEEAREVAEVKELEQVVETKMQQLVDVYTKYVGRDQSRLSDLEKAAVSRAAHSDALTARRDKKRRGGDGPAACVPAVFHDPGGASDPVHRQTLRICQLCQRRFGFVL